MPNNVENIINKDRKRKPEDIKLRKYHRELDARYTRSAKSWLNKNLARNLRI